MQPPRSVIRAPELAPGEWLNTPRPLTLAEQRGRAVLAHIWDYTCINCVRTLPYVTAWQRAYGQGPVTFIGIHTPEFEFARERRKVAAALAQYGVTYPVLLDNDLRNWEAFANRYWPTTYLIDAAGYIRYQHAGEGQYAETEAALTALMAEAGDKPEAAPVGVLREEDRPGAVCFRVTPELQAGFARGVLGNREGYAPRQLPVIYRLPAAAEQQDGYFYVEGTWQAGREYLALAGEQGVIELPYHAAGANAVLAPSGDPVELRLDLKAPVSLDVYQDGAPLDGLHAGADIGWNADGQSVLVVDQPRMYALTRNPDARPHRLRLEAAGRGLALFSFSFSTCVKA
ncbi:MAG: redoxin family protein [Anaerolineales bacterium]|nr:redoxin family protein [Anaerolineales bacterium]